MGKVVGNRGKGEWEEAGEWEEERGERGGWRGGGGEKVV